ncbi:M14 family zinc carboxypeptidase [uncultured Shewanella sp.]|uniref:M14 family zinc carboxypeptidase n=1 Tax=uncultured Shewanella sp. TaxID=173975 RepID=UPI00261D8FA1|nr:M14 family zinc carboxypeptidase [uncultured Shewanella sp.]
MKAYSIICCFFYMVSFNISAQSTSEITTPFQASAQSSLPTSSEINVYLKQVTKKSDLASMVQLGLSAGKRPINAIRLSKDPKFLNDGLSAPKKLTVMLVASQHGNEPSGAEAMQILIKDIVFGQNKKLLDTMDLLIIVMANPDGRDLQSRSNAANENLNIDYTAVKSSETQMYINVLNEYQPNVLFDIHESGIYKRILSGEQGYMTDVEAQFEIGNNPNIDFALRDYSENIFLPALIKAVNQAGLRTKRYQGEITQLKQAVRRGGLGISNLRNYAAMQGILSVLLENRLDSKQGTYPSPRNIKERVRKQLLSTETFLNLVANNASTILNVTDNAAEHWSSGSENEKEIALNVHFDTNKQQPVTQIPLTKIATGKNILQEFANNDAIIAEMTIPLPKAYVINKHQLHFKQWLSHHHIKHYLIEKSQILTLESLFAKNINTANKHKPGIRDFVSLTLMGKIQKIPVTTADIWIPLDQPKAALAAIMLDPRSSTAIFQEPNWQPLLKEAPLALSILPRGSQIQRLAKP